MSLTFSHNFCESRLNDNNPPELLNAISSFVICLIPFIFEFPVNYLVLSIRGLLIINGFSSFIYHYYLNWLGKQLDEVSMILITMLFCKLTLETYYKDRLKYYYYFNWVNILYCIIFISINTIPSYDIYFPFAFGIYVKYVSVFFILTMMKFNVKYKYWLIPILISLTGALFWFISELFCNKITKFGHVIWHMLFPLGFYKILLTLDKINFNEFYD